MDPNNELKRDIYEEIYEDLTGENWDGSDESLYDTVDSLEGEGWGIEVIE